MSSRPPAGTPASTPSSPNLDPLRALIRRAVDDVLAQAERGVENRAPAAPSSTKTPADRNNTASPQGRRSTETTSRAGATIAIGADHGGFAMKEDLSALLRERGYSVTDCGTYSTDSCDYPDFAHEVARRVAEGSCQWGIMIDGAGIGSSMVANKVPGIRAALCYDLSSARNSREHNHANVLTLGASLIGPGLARQIVETWLETAWGEGRHSRRVDKITEVERRYQRAT